MEPYTHIQRHGDKQIDRKHTQTHVVSDTDIADTYTYTSIQKK